MEASNCALRLSTVSFLAPASAKTPGVSNKHVVPIDVSKNSQRQQQYMTSIATPDISNNPRRPQQYSASTKTPASAKIPGSNVPRRQQQTPTSAITLGVINI